MNFYKIEDVFIGDIYFTNKNELIEIIIKKCINDDFIKVFLADSYLEHDNSDRSCSESFKNSREIFYVNEFNNGTETFTLHSKITNTSNKNFTQIIEIRADGNFTINRVIFNYNSKLNPRPYENDVLINEIVLKFRNSLIDFFIESENNELLGFSPSFFTQNAQLLFMFSNSFMKNAVLNITDFDTLMKLGIMKEITEKEYKLNHIKKEFK